MPSVSLPAAGAVLTAASSVFAGVSAGAAASYSAQVAKNNATIASQNELRAAQAGSVQTEEAGLKARAETAGIRSGIAANNLDVNSGSPADVQTSQRELGFLNTANVGANAAKQVYSYGVQRGEFEAQSNLEAQEAWEAPLGSAIGSAGQLLSNPAADAWLNGPGNQNSSSDMGTSNSMPAPILNGNPTVPSWAQWMLPTGYSGIEPFDIE